ncbi:hypothetical protein GCM10011383_42220 [Hymenobacter cavernae]|uniref:Uncharacterized protein n=1 Tax=Hymenobacter cavernae TaxID=2044852 RepID=A0ABQ1UVN6_9BACT|nr:hypothetical protein GCM10011383_42220 [Hymenobacter cavernae]
MRCHTQEKLPGSVARTWQSAYLLALLGADYKSARSRGLSDCSGRVVRCADGDYKFPTLNSRIINSAELSNCPQSIMDPAELGPV